MDSSEFVDPHLSAACLDTFIPRHAIWRALRENCGSLQGRLLDIGCGRMPYREQILAQSTRITQYIGLDIALPMYAQYRPDLYWDGSNIPLASDSIDSAMALEVLEHCPDPGRVLREAHRVMRPSGFLLITAPFLWPLHDDPYDEYRYTPYAMHRLLRESGFSDANVKPLGGWDASLAQMLGLWARRRPMSTRKRWLISQLLLPFVRYLSEQDPLGAVSTGQSFAGLMITGLVCTATKL